MSDDIRVGIGSYVVAEDETPISIFGLGSCIGVLLYDDKKKVAALAHILLPDTKNEMKKKEKPGKYVSSALDLMLSNMLERGCRRDGIIAKIAGGAHMFKFSSPKEKITIGKKNIAAVRQQLRKLNIELVAEDVGGGHGRSMMVDPSTGTVRIRSIKHGIKEI